MIIFKCGECGKEFEVDEERIISKKFGYRCSNCGTEIPINVVHVADRLVKMEETDSNQKWGVYRIPEKYAKAQVTLTLPLE
jgi:DNA-directed RNA polymerase subunit RPC12/RpoP